MSNITQSMHEPEFDNQPDAGQSTSSNFFVSAVGFEGSLAVLAVILGLVFGPRANALVPIYSDWESILGGLIVGCLCALPMVVCVQWLQRLDIPSVREIDDFIHQHLIPMMRQLTIPELLVVSICAGVGEELLFRGWLQMLITGPPSQWTPWSLVIGISVASLAFGMAHAITRLYVLVVFLLGIVFGIMLVVSGNLLVPIAAHALFDFIQLVRAVREPIDDEVQTSITDP